ncbi:hypothetical protein AYI68_g1060 [Smittium mucronatum]|uniref:Uncharacterized protein n=1 Tax=Smittium mucronatum TaxID=133383 RepID=A0A1R0H6L7_9FUNG|nr:hypothetical protein AYI68_g1060 [Smittium mucronatum]
MVVGAKSIPEFFKGSVLVPYNPPPHPFMKILVVYYQSIQITRLVLLLSGGYSSYSAMGMVMSNHELVESGAYPYGFAPEVEAWREVADDRDSDTSVSSSSEVLALGDDLDPSVNLAVEPDVENLRLL